MISLKTGMHMNQKVNLNPPIYTHCNKPLGLTFLNRSFCCKHIWQLSLVRHSRILHRCYQQAFLSNKQQCRWSELLIRLKSCRVIPWYSLNARGSKRFCWTLTHPRCSVNSKRIENVYAMYPRLLQGDIGYYAEAENCQYWNQEGTRNDCWMWAFDWNCKKKEVKVVWACVKKGRNFGMRSYARLG